MSEDHDSIRIISGKTAYSVITIGLAACLLYIALLYRYFGSGFPFDDAWIHRVYARNFVKYGTLTYNGDRITVGESSYLYCFLLTLGYILGIDPVIYMYITGAVFYLLTLYFGTGILNTVSIRSVKDSNYSSGELRLRWAIFLSVLFAVNPAFIALYFNGMATGMTSFLITLLIYLFLKGKYRWFSAVLPLLFLARGETIVAAAVPGTLMLIRMVRWSNGCNTVYSADPEKGLCGKSINLLSYYIPLVCTILFYCIFHLTVNGTPFPNTAIKMPIMENLQNFGAQFGFSVIFDNLKAIFLSPNTFFHVLITSISVITVFSVCGKYLRGQTIGTSDSATVGIIPVILPLTWYFTYIGGQTYPFINLSPYFLKYWEFTLAPAYFSLIAYHILTFRFGLRSYKLRYFAEVWLINVSLTVLWIISVFFGGYHESSSIFVYPPVSTVIIISAVISTLILLSPFVTERLKKRGRRSSVRKILRPVSGNKVISVITVFGVIFSIIVFLPTIGLYGEHIREINSQHVKIGLWIRENTPQNAIIATHDAGAVKYFSDRKVIDLWALNNMDIFKIYREVSLEAERFGSSHNSSIDKLLEERIWEYLISIHVEYIICRPDVFTYLTDTTVHPELEVVRIFYAENSYFLGNNMMICYRINYSAID